MGKKKQELEEQPEGYESDILLRTKQIIDKVVKSLCDDGYIVLGAEFEVLEDGEIVMHCETRLPFALKPKPEEGFLDGENKQIGPDSVSGTGNNSGDGGSGGKAAG